MLRSRPAPSAAPPAAVARRAGALLGASVLAKLALLVFAAIDGGGRLAPFGTWTAPLALWHEDLWAVAGFVALDVGLQVVGALLGAAGRAATGAAAWLLLVGAVVWVAGGVPTARVLGTPSTWPMLKAAGGASGEALSVQLTIGHGLAVLAVIAGAVAGARVGGRYGRRPVAGAAVLGVLTGLSLSGPWSVASLPAPSLGLHRNALVTVAWSAAQWQLGSEPSAGAAGQAGPPGDGAAPALPVLPSAELEPYERPVDLRHLAGAAAGRNVLWLVLESTGARYLQAFNPAMDRDAMPRLTALMAAPDTTTVRFPHAYAAYPERIKGFHSGLCGESPADFTDASAYAPGALPARCAPQHLGDAGYASGLFHSGYFADVGMHRVVEGRGFDVALDARAIAADGAARGARASSAGVDDAATVARALAWIDEVRAASPGRSWFAMVVPIAGHHPYRSPGDGPRPWPERTKYERYLNDLHQGDAALGRLFDGLAERRLLESTLVTVYAHHGEAFDQHPGNCGHTRYVYEENVHVPMAWILPGRPASSPGAVHAEAAGDGGPGLRAPQLASVVDVLPTTLALLGLPAEARGHAPSPEGRSLLTPHLGAARFFADYGRPQRGLRHGRWKLLEDLSGGPARLYDLAADPDERWDESAAQRARVEAYRAHLDAWQAQRRVRLISSR